MDAADDSIAALPSGSLRPETMRRARWQARLTAVLNAIFEHCASWRLESLVRVAILVAGIVYCGLTMAVWTATRQAIDQTRDQMLLAQRPWIIVPKIELSEPLTASHPVRVAVSLKNTGLSPALGVVTSGTLAIRESAPGFISRLTGRSERRTDMGASDLQSIYVELDGGEPLRADDLAVLRSAKQSLYAIVEIAYTDPFGHPGATNVCAVYRPALQDFGPCTAGTELR
jgi:hypothetical protein